MGVELTSSHRKNLTVSHPRKRRGHAPKTGRSATEEEEEGEEEEEEQKAEELGKQKAKYMCKHNRKRTHSGNNSYSLPLFFNFENGEKVLIAQNITTTRIFTNSYTN
jgi:hypothetical protein